MEGGWSSRAMIPLLGVMRDAVPEVAYAPSMDLAGVWTDQPTPQALDVSRSRLDSFLSTRPWWADATSCTLVDRLSVLSPCASSKRAVFFDVVVTSSGGFVLASGRGLCLSDYACAPHRSGFSIPSRSRPVQSICAADFSTIIMHVC